MILDGSRGILALYLVRWNMAPLWLNQSADWERGFPPIKYQTSHITFIYTPAQWSWGGGGGGYTGITLSACLSVRPSVGDMVSVTQVCFGFQFKISYACCWWPWAEAYWFSAMSLSKWPPGGYLGFFGFQTNFCLASNIKSKLQEHITSVYEKKPIYLQICHFQNGRLVVKLEFLVSRIQLQFGFEFQIQNSAAHFLHVPVNRRLVILKDVQLQSMYFPLNTHFRWAEVS